MRVLVVDDSASNLMILQSLLEDEGHSVEVADSFAQANERLSGDAVYDIVLLDQHLGDGLGTNLLPTMRARMPMLKVVLISGSSQGELPTDSGLDAVIDKGCDFDVLAALMKQLLEEPRAT